MSDATKTIGTIDLSPANPGDITVTRRIRAVTTHTLLAYICDRGILFHDRRSGLQHICTWEDVRAILPPIEEK